MTFSSECRKDYHEQGVGLLMRVHRQNPGQFSNLEDFKIWYYTNFNVISFCCESGAFGHKKQYVLRIHNMDINYNIQTSRISRWHSLNVI